MIEGFAYTEIAAIDLEEGRTRQAIEHATLALAIHRRTGHRLGRTETQRILADARER